MGVFPEDIILAQEASRLPQSIHETVYENEGDPITLMDQIADDSEEAWFDKVALKEAINRLDEREQLIVFFVILKTRHNLKWQNVWESLKFRFLVWKRRSSSGFAKNLKAVSKK